MAVRINQFARDEMNIYIDQIEDYPIVRSDSTGQLYQPDSEKYLNRLLNDGWTKLSTEEAVRYIETIFHYQDKGIE